MGELWFMGWVGGMMLAGEVCAYGFDASPELDPVGMPAKG
jgi:hypothetical protein